MGIQFRALIQCRVVKNSAAIIFGAAECAFQVFVLDLEKPTVTCPTSMTVSSDANKCTAMVKFAGASMDNCGVTSDSFSIANGSDFIVDTQELQRAGGSYTFDTLTALRSNYPKVPLLLFIGSDAFNDFTTWFRWKELFNLAHVVVITRPNATLNPLNEFFKTHLTNDKKILKQEVAGLLFFQQITQLEISATAIRGMITTRKNPCFLLPDAVIDYIYQHQLYF